MENHEQITKNWYDKYYKKMLLPPIILFVICIVYLVMFYNANGDFIFKDSSLAGGTTITVNGNIDYLSLEDALKTKFADVKTRGIKDLGTGESIAVIVDSSASPEELKPEIEAILGYAINDENSSIEFTGPSLSQNFYKQLLTAIIFSFILMSITIFFLFRTFIPSIAVIFAALADIIMTVAFVNFLGI